MQIVGQVLIFVGIGAAMYFLFRRGIGSCCGGHGAGGCCSTTGSQKCASDDGTKPDYHEETPKDDERA